LYVGSEYCEEDTFDAKEACEYYGMYCTVMDDKGCASCDECDDEEMCPECSIRIYSPADSIILSVVPFFFGVGPKTSPSTTFVLKMSAIKIQIFFLENFFDSAFSSLKSKKNDFENFHPGH